MRTLSPREMAIAALSEWSCLVNLPGLGGLALGPSHNVAGHGAYSGAGRGAGRGWGRAPGGPVGFFTAGGEAAGAAGLVWPHRLNPAGGG